MGKEIPEIMQVSLKVTPNYVDTVVNTTAKGPSTMWITPRNNILCPHCKDVYVSTTENLDLHYFGDCTLIHHDCGEKEDFCGC